jgi:acetate kinase
MGLTPLEGLVMGTRSGDGDLAVPFYVMKKTGMSAGEMEGVLNKKSGLLGITGKYTDRRDIQAAAQQGDQRASLAQDIEAYRVRKYIGAYMAALGRVDALVLTAGVGEFASFIRSKILEGLRALGVIYDPAKNELARTRNTESCISTPDSAIPVFIIPTDEELVMTEDAYALLAGTYDVHTRFSYSFQSRDYVNKGRAEGLKEDLAKNPKLAEIIAKPR